MISGPFLGGGGRRSSFYSTQNKGANTGWLISITVVIQGNVLKPLEGKKGSPIYGACATVLNKKADDVGYFVTSGGSRTTMVRGVVYASLGAGMVNSIDYAITIALKDLTVSTLKDKYCNLSKSGLSSYAWRRGQW